MTKTTSKLIDQGRKPCPKSSDGKHEWILGRLKSQDSVWVCRLCGAIRVKQIPFATTETNLETALEVFPYLGSLIEELRNDWRNMSLDEKGKLVEKILDQIGVNWDLVQGTHRAQQAWIDLSKKVQKDYDNFVKYRQGRPMMLNEPRKIQRWMHEQLEEQKFYFLFKDIVFHLKNMDVKQTTREFKALNRICKYMDKITRRLITKFKEANEKQAIIIAAELKKRGIHITKIRISQ